MGADLHNNQGIKNRRYFSFKGAVAGELRIF
jgi:hypothetical protein